MTAEIFDEFRVQLKEISDRLDSVSTKSLRDEDVLEQIRSLYRSWATTVRGTLERLLDNKHDFYKLEAELLALAALTSKSKPVAEYRKRLTRTLHFAHQLVLHLPPSGGGPGTARGRTWRESLFLPEIPDIPLALVPNALLGWKSAMEAFLAEYSFDSSVFVMIRYRDRNREIIAHI